MDTVAGREPAYGGYCKVLQVARAKSAFLQACYHGGHTWLKGARVTRWGRIPEITAWSENPLDRKKNGWHQPAALFSGIVAGKLAENSES